MKWGIKVKVAIVTGTSSGVGLATVIQLAKDGYSVIALMRHSSNTAEMDNQLYKHCLTEHVECIKLNMESREEIVHIISYIHSKYKRLDILINNAGYAQGGLVELLSEESWQKQYNTNIGITINFCYAVAPIMRIQRFGKIINIGSISGQLGLPSFGPYAMSKFALAGFSESLRFELLPFQVYVVLIEAGSYQTAIWKKGFSQLPSNTIEDYEHLQNRMVALTDASSRTKNQPTSFALYILKICRTKKPSLYYQTTLKVKSTIMLKYLVGWRLYEYVMNRFIFKFKLRNK